MTERWKAIVSFYEDLVFNHGWPLKPMIDLATMMSKSEQFKFIYPSTSHYTLVLSRYKEYSERRKHPMVIITYCPADDVFEIEYDKEKLREKSLRTEDFLTQILPYLMLV